ncbi:hypothetical protein [Butyrivibrio fibrisolvens]|uniref:Uncharacterized protein n=1 Tax=Butyrivibrio fibrisolvens TaxID=831 RepID=A0A317G340_BUTFI|nr:hypothetical protein [Butyrivibrio fibrisolvens]PWT27033.1 hypothetical protein CPT75_07910 [Butyrivibrio fibrisolvens]
MGQTITLYRVSLDGQRDLIAFLGEQDAQTYSTILFSGYDQYMILESETDIEDIKGEYTYTICDDLGEIPFDIVFIRDKKIRNVFILTLMFAMAGLSIENYDLTAARNLLTQLSSDLDNLGTDDIPLSYIQKQAAKLRSVAMA